VKYDVPKKDVGFFDGLKSSVTGSNTYKAKLFIDVPNFQDIRARPNKSFRIPLQIQNPYKNVIPADTLILVRNNFDLRIKNQLINIPLEPKQQMQITLEGITTTRPNNYEIEISLYHKDINFEQDPLRVKIEVNEDENEEQLDDFFQKYDKLKLIPKKCKSIIQEIILDNISDKDPEMIYYIMLKHNWNLSEAIDDLTMELKREVPFNINK